MLEKYADVLIRFEGLEKAIWELQSIKRSERLAMLERLGSVKSQVEFLANQKENALLRKLKESQPTTSAKVSANV